MKKIVVSFNTGLHQFGSSIAAIVNFFLMSLVYLLGIAGTAALYHLFIKEKEPINTSQWKRRKDLSPSTDTYYRQF